VSRASLFLDGSDNDNTLDIGWKEIAMFGALSEHIAYYEKESETIVSSK